MEVRISEEHPVVLTDDERTHYMERGTELGADYAIAYEKGGHVCVSYQLNSLGFEMGREIAGPRPYERTMRYSFASRYPREACGPMFKTDMFPCETDGTCDPGCNLGRIETAVPEDLR